jgi:hypothetical protein
MRQVLIDPEEFLAWLRGTPKAAPQPPPPPKRTTKTFTVTMLRRDVVVPPTNIFQREEL